MSARAIGILGGYGETGHHVAAELIATTDHEIILAGRDFERARLTAEKLGPRVRPMAVDVYRREQIDALCAESAVVVNCAGPACEVLESAAIPALAHGCHYIDPGGYEILHRRLLKYADRIAAQKLTFLLSAGWIPGISEVLVSYVDGLARQRMDRVHRIELFYGDRNEWSEVGARDMVWRIRCCALEGIGEYRRGIWKKRNLLASSTVMDLGAPLGKQRAFLHFDDELVPFAKARADYERVTSYVIELGLGAQITFLLIRFLLGHNDARSVKWLKAAFRRAYEKKGKRGAAFVRVFGESNGRPSLLSGAIVDDRHYFLTGVAPALAARLALMGKGIQRGLCYLGDGVDPSLFMTELSKRGVTIDITQTGERD